MFKMPQGFIVDWGVVDKNKNILYYLQKVRNIVLAGL